MKSKNKVSSIISSREMQINIAQRHGIYLLEQLKEDSDAEKLTCAQEPLGLSDKHITIV